MDADPVELEEARELGRTLRHDFDTDGYVIVPHPVLSRTTLESARQHLQDVFRGVYDLGLSPVKPLKSLSSSFQWDGVLTQNKTAKKVQVMHVINAWRCDSFFRDLATSQTLGRFVAAVCGWEERGCRFAQDQVWVKPAGAGPLAFHRDTTYFDFVPKEVATVWFTLDDTRATTEFDMGPLEYCAGSHRWGIARRGSANQFFDPDYKAMLRDAAQREVAGCGASASHDEEHPMHSVWKSAAHLQIRRVEVDAGSFSIHNGNTWHGSGGNKHPSAFRRGFGLHFIPGDAVFDVKDLGTLWRPYCADINNPQLPEENFPWVFQPTSA